MRISDWSSDVCSSDLRASCASGTTPANLIPEHKTNSWESRHEHHRQARPHHRRVKRHRPRAGAGTVGEGGESGDQRTPPGSRRRSRAIRSEEHTSELQSLMRISYAVFCLKKKKNNTKHRRRT